MSKIVTFGEIMLRLTPPLKEVILQTPQFIATPGGAEANVAVSLANYGEDVSYVTALPENPIAEAIIRELKKFNINTESILRSGDRVGTYYTQTGSVMRPSKVIYDRAHSAISEVKPGDFDWDKILDNTSWFHVTGITPAIAEGTAAVTMEALKKCREKGITVSCDLNYRKKLWKWGKSAVEVMAEVAKYVDVMIANEEDCQKCLGIELDVDVTSGSLDADKYQVLASKVMERYSNVKYLAVSLRESISADHNNWSGVLATSDSFFKSRKYEITHIVDRIGGGDSFGAGLIYGLNRLNDDQTALDFAIAASAIKHTIYGDFNRVSKEEVFSLMDGDASGRVQR
jgi:2-dehydro-3-deoxygluconokinase